MENQIQFHAERHQVNGGKGKVMIRANKVAWERADEQREEQRSEAGRRVGNELREAASKRNSSLDKNQ